MNDKESLMKAMKNGEYHRYNVKNFFKSLSEELRNDREVVLEAVKLNNDVLAYVDNEELKNDKEIILLAMKETGLALVYAGKELRNDKEIVLKAVGDDGVALELASEELKNDKEVVMEAVKDWGYNLRYASKELKNDKEIVLEAVKNNNGRALEYASEELKNDKEVVWEAVRAYAIYYLEVDGYNYDYEVDGYNYDYEENNPNPIEYASEKLKNDEEFILETEKIIKKEEEKRRGDKSLSELDAELTELQGKEEQAKDLLNKYEQNLPEQKRTGDQK